MSNTKLLIEKNDQQNVLHTKTTTYNKRHLSNIISYQGIFKFILKIHIITTIFHSYLFICFSYSKIK